MSTLDQTLRTFFSKTATCLRSQRETIAQLEKEAQARDTELTKLRTKERVRDLAKMAASRGLIEDGVDAADEWVNRTLESGRPLDVVEQGLEYASSAPESAIEKDASDSESVGSKHDPLTAFLMGGSFTE